MPRIRTIQEAYRAIKEADSGTAITPHSIRRLILNGDIPSIRAGNKYLVDLDTLEAYLRNPAPERTNNNYGVIRPISERRLK